MGSYGALGDGPSTDGTAGDRPTSKLLSVAESRTGATRFKDPDIEERNVAHQWWVQYETLFRKNLALLWHKKVFTTALILFPSVFVVILWWMSSAIGHKSTLPIDLSTVHACHTFDVYNNPVNGDSCITIMYSPDTPDTKSIMGRFCDATGLTCGTDVVPMASEEAVMGYMFDNLGKVDTAISFTNPNYTMEAINYNIWVNSSRFFAYSRLGEDDLFSTSNMNGRITAIQNQIEAALIGFVGSLHGYTKATASVSPTFQFFEVEDKNNLFNSASANIIQIAAPVLLVCGVTVSALMMLNIVTTEKHNKLLGAMRTVGIWDSAHWVSWFTVFFITAIPLGLIAAGFGKASGISLFYQCDYSIQFVAFTLFAASFGAYCIWVGSFVSRPIWVNVSSFMVFAISTILSFLFTTLFPINSMYAPSLTFVAKFIFFLCPFFHYAKILSNILEATAVSPGSHHSLSSFTWADVGKHIGPIADVKNGVTVHYYAPSVGFSMGMLVVLMLIYLTMAWYFGQVFSGDLGASQRFYFPFSPAYWGWGTKEEIIPGDTLAIEKERSRNDRSIRLHKLSKSYDKTTALKEVSLEMAESQCLSLLGQNGAGKTTLVNVVSGLLAPTHGHAFIFGDSVATDIATLRGIMGSCPQHDLLWLELSARQHLQIYARLKGVSRAETEAHVQERLAAVNLQDDSDVPVSGFSGGMKRRLSVAIASMGSPRVLFLDEPTTGMDPLSRRRVWSLIEDLKVGRVVLLTTHSMEEADALGDQIAIMSQGRLRAVGTSLFLKNRFGAGYQINLLSTPSRVDELKQLVSEMLPGSEIVGDNAGNITVGLPRSSTAHVPNFLRRLAASSTDLVKEWGLSNSTLDEVFLRLAVQSQGINETTEDTVTMPGARGPPTAPRGICVLCQARPTCEVSLFTSKGVSVTASDLICSSCAELSPTEAATLPGVIAAARAALAEAGVDEETKDEPAMIDDRFVPETAEVEADGVAVTVADDAAVAEAAATAQAAKRTSKNMERLSVEGGHRRAKDLRPVSMLAQARAVLYMRTEMQWKQKKTNICYIIFLIIVVLLTYLLEPSISKQNLCAGGWLKLAALSDDDDGGLPAQVFDNCNRTEIIEYMTKAVPYRSLVVEQNAYPFGQQVLPDWSENQWVNNLQGYEGVNAWYKDATGSGQVPLDQWDILGQGVGQMSVAEVISFSKANTGSQTVAEEVYDAQQTVAEHSAKLLCEEFGTDGWEFPSGQAASDWVHSHFPDFALTLSEAKPHPVRQPDGTYKVELAYTMHTYNPDSYYNNAQVYYNSTANPALGFCNQIFVQNNIPFWQKMYQPPKLPQMQAVNGINNGLLRTMLGDGHSRRRWLKPKIAALPPFEFPTAVGRGSIILQAFLFPLFTMFLLPPMVSAVVGEKEKRLYQMMKMEGMKAPGYWLGTYIFNVIYFLLIAGVYIIAGYVMSIGSVTHTSPLLFVAVLGLWAHTQCGLAFFLASLFPRARLSSIVSYMLVVLVAITSGVLSVQGLDPWPMGLLWVTPLGYSRAIVLLLSYGGSVIRPGSELSRACIMLVVTGTIEMALGMYLHAVIPDIDGVRASPWFCIYWCRRRRPPAIREAATDDSLIAGMAVAEDEDVVAERRRVVQQMDPKRAIEIRGLVKTFTRPGHEPKRAVRDLTIAAEYGTTLGLLGPNGAGKTTTIAMLTGAIHRTAGLATVGGFDTSSQMELVYRILGVCPQFDTVWDDLTCSEHLRFYARVKGIPEKMITAAVQHTAEKVDLDGDPFNMKSSELSGGMRRRLSLGIALIGDPAVVFLDEPTTGLDPETRRSIWDIIQREQESGRCILLTTHAMEEADTLCSRIAIMAHGKLRSVGTQLHLKNRFGDGYKLSLILKNEGPEAVAAADAFVARFVSRRARQVNAVGKTVDYVLPRTGVDVAALFQVLEARKASGGIVEFGVSAASLEEVFVKVVMKAEDEEDMITAAGGGKPPSRGVSRERPLSGRAGIGAGAGAGADAV